LGVGPKRDIITNGPRVPQIFIDVRPDPKVPNHPAEIYTPSIKKIFFTKMKPGCYLTVVMNS